VAKPEVFVKYMKLFESMPSVLAFGQTLFVHGGIPRDATLRARWQGLQSLDDWDLRFEMLWSDPSEADLVPDALQEESARFPFGRKQLRRFLARVGCTALVRGHQRVVEGFARHYDDPGALLLTVFSAGGADNEDLPPDSTYREVAPKALTVRRTGGVTTYTPFEIDYARYNQPEYNAFFREKLGAG
jgi:hypothetical protein